MTAPEKDDRSALPDPRFDAAWRASSNEEPPAALDAMILAAARREVGAGPRSVRAQMAMDARRRWWPLAAAATIAAVAVGLLQLVIPEQLNAPSVDNAVVSDMPAPGAKASADVSRQGTNAEQPASRADAPTAPASAQRPAPAAEAPKKTAPSVDVPQRPAPATAPSPQGKLAAAPDGAASVPDPFPAAQEREFAAAQRSEIAAATPPASSLAAAPPPASFAAVPRVPASPVARPAPLAKTATGSASANQAEKVQTKDLAPLPVPDWIALIRRLRSEGKTTEAAKELAAFRVEHVDHAKLLPLDLRDWRPPAQ